MITMTIEYYQFLITMSDGRSFQVGVEADSEADAFDSIQTLHPESEGFEAELIIAFQGRIPLTLWQAGREAHCS